MVLVLCTGDGPMLMTLDAESGTLRKAPPAAPKAACDWAMTAIGLTLPSPVALPLPPAGQWRAHFAQVSLDFRPAHDPRGLYARGPPFLI